MEYETAVVVELDGDRSPDKPFGPGEALIFPKRYKVLGPAERLFAPVMTACDDCKGTGRCPECRGKGTIAGEECEDCDGDRKCPECSMQKVNNKWQDNPYPGRVPAYVGDVDMGWERYFRDRLTGRIKLGERGNRREPVGVTWRRTLPEATERVPYASWRSGLRQVRQALLQAAQGPWTVEDSPQNKALAQKLRRTVQRVWKVLVHEIPLFPSGDWVRDPGRFRSALTSHLTRLFTDWWQRPFEFVGAYAKDVAPEVSKRADAVLYVSGSIQRILLRDMQASALRKQLDSWPPAVGRFVEALQAVVDTMEKGAPSGAAVTVARGGNIAGIHVENEAGMSPATWTDIKQQVALAAQLLKRAGFGFLLSGLPVRIRSFMYARQAGGSGALGWYASGPSEGKANIELFVSGPDELAPAFERPGDLAVTLVHEFGHHYYYTKLPRTARDEFEGKSTRLATDFPSSYATTHPKEDFAEIFTAYVLRNAPFGRQRLSQDSFQRFKLAVSMDPKSKIKLESVEEASDSALVKRVQAALSDDLRRPPWRGTENPLAGHCYVASEALYHLLGGRAAGWKPMFVRHEGHSHWFLRKGVQILDPTASQFTSPVPYEKARGKGFLTKAPSARAKRVMGAVAPHELQEGQRNAQSYLPTLPPRWPSGVYLHGTSRKFDRFKVGSSPGKSRANALYFSDPSRRPDRKTQAEHIAEGPFGGYLVAVRVRKGKRFDQYNDEVAKEIFDRHNSYPDKLFHYPDAPDIIRDAVKQGYSTFRVYEDSVQDFSLAVSDPALIEIVQWYAVKRHVVEAKQLNVNDDRPDFMFYEEGGRWYYLPDIKLGYGDRWYMAAGLSSQNGWKTLNVSKTTEHDPSIQKALKEMLREYPELKDYVISFDGPYMPYLRALKATPSSRVNWRTIKLYHATSMKAWEVIQREGLRPRGTTGTAPVHGVAMSARPSLPDRVYLTTQTGVLSFAANDAARAHKSKPAILEIRGVPDPSLLEPDEDSRASTPEESLARSGSVAYRGTIPPSRIRLVSRMQEARLSGGEEITVGAQVTFRLGEHVLSGEVVEARRGVYRLQLPEAAIAVREEFILSEGTAEGPPYQEAATSALVRHLMSGSPIRLGESRVMGVDEQRGIHIVREDADRGTWIPLSRILEHSLLGQTLALEARREVLEARGLVEVGRPVLGASRPLPRPAHCFMRMSPYRDVTRLHPGTVCEVTGYYRGCAVIEADGEPLFLPVESLSLIEYQNTKDTDYYLTLDANNDNIPDPLEALPSKVALGSRKYASPENNYQAQPYLKTVAGQFYPLPVFDVRVEDDLRESYGALFYHEDYQHHYPELHGLGGTPAHPAAQRPDAEAMTDRILQGESAEHYLEVRPDGSTFRKEFGRVYLEVFGRGPDPSLVDDMTVATR